MLILLNEQSLRLPVIHRNRNKLIAFDLSMFQNILAEKMLICGIDEAGRGPLAGPVVAAAVLMEEGMKIDGARDSKALAESARLRLFDKIKLECIDASIGIADNSEIDATNILKATMLAMLRAIRGLRLRPDMFFIDGNYFRLEGEFEKYLNYRTIVKGDALRNEISCASILAKVTRDEIMKKYHLSFPVYNFFSNKGYPTKKHIDAIKQNGICEIHRSSFCKKFLNTEQEASEQVHL